MILHLVLLALAAFCIWEAAKPFLPWNLPGLVLAGLIFGIVCGLDHWVTDKYLGLLGVVAVVGVLHQKFGATTTGSWSVSLPAKRGKIALP